MGYLQANINHNYGACCAELDIMEANLHAAAYTIHPCSTTGVYRCSGNKCGDDDQRYSSVCDKDGCGFNSWGLGDQTFLGKGLTIDTRRKFTVVTQFITADGTANGDLVEMRRLYVQDGVVHQNSAAKYAGLPASRSLTNKFCDAQKSYFGYGGTDSFEASGGIASMGRALADGMVLTFSLWADASSHMLWLDGTYANANPSTPGASHGPCSTNSGNPDDIRNQQPGATVTYSNIRYGDIGSTYSGSQSPKSLKRRSSILDRAEAARAVVGTKTIGTAVLLVLVLILALLPRPVPTITHLLFKSPVPFSHSESALQDLVSS
jgi:cellulose 1,4-beta-cellobiosidase